MFPRTIWLPLLALFLVGCQSDEEQGPGAFRAGTLEPVRTLELEEADSAYIGQIFTHASLDFGSDGRLLVGDRFSSRVLVFDSTGALAAVTGREGQGPGEYQTILAVGWESEDRVWVISVDRITRLTADLAIVETHPSRGDPYSWTVQFSPNRAFVGRYHSVNQGDAIEVRSSSGDQALRTILPYGPLGKEPYVMSVYQPVFRVVGDTLLAGFSAEYPLKVMTLDGEELAEFGTAPPSLGTMRVPRYAEFAADPRQGDAWMRTFGIVSSIWVAHDSLIVVEHRRPHPEPGGIPVATYRIDVYDRWSLAKLVEDLELPGPIMDWHDGLLWVLTDLPPGPWTFTGFRVGVE